MKTSSNANPNANTDINAKKKFRIALLCFCIILAVLMALINYIVSNSVLNDKLVYFSPKSGASINVPFDTIEKDINEQKFLITYESKENKTINANNNKVEAVIKYTNYTYPYVMDYSIISGGFFTKESQKNKKRSAALNEKAAFDIFGSTLISGNVFEIDGEKYYMSGVIDDRDVDNRNIYIPASISPKNDSAFICEINNESGMSGEYTLSELKRFGITEDAYDIINFSDIKQLFINKFLLLIYIFSIGVIVILYEKIIKAFLNIINEFKLILQKSYLKEIIIHQSSKVTKIMLLSAFLIFAPCILLTILIVMLDIFLSSGGIANSINSISEGVFGSNSATIQNMHIYSNIIIPVFVAAVMALIFTGRIKKTDNTNYSSLTKR